MGAVTNFLLGRYWVFNAADQVISQQASRYAVVSLGSVLLNTFGVYLLTENSSLDYKLSKVIVAVIIAVTYNFFMQKNYVYK